MRAATSLARFTPTTIEVSRSIFEMRLSLPLRSKENPAGLRSPTRAQGAALSWVTAPWSRRI